MPPPPAPPTPTPSNASTSALPVASTSARPVSSTSVSSTSMPSVDEARRHLQKLDENSGQFRILNALLEYAPTVEGLNVIATDIITASTEPDGLNQLADFYTRGLLLPMKAAGQTPNVSKHPSRGEEIEADANTIAAKLETAKRDSKNVKEHALNRDGHRCVVTGKWDRLSLKLPHVREEFDSSTSGKDYGFTEAAHILPFSLMKVDTNKMLLKKCTVWAVIKSFTNIEFTELNGENINSLTNVITLDISAHKVFGSLSMCFEAVEGKANVYKITEFDEFPLYNDSTEVTLTSPDPALPLPDPGYLALHAAVAKVVHMAGMAEHLDDIIQKYENIRVVSDDFGLEYLDGQLRMAQKCVLAY